MAFPVVAGTATTNGTTATTTPAVNLPASIAAGDLLVVLFRTAIGTAGVAWPAGWTELVESTADAADDATAIAYRAADGTEGATISLTTSSAKFAAIAYRITDAEDPATQPPQISTAVTGTSTSPNPGGVTPTGGAKDYLWLWLGGWEGEQTSPPTGVPTLSLVDMLGPLGADSGTAGAVATNCRVASAHLGRNQSSGDASLWSISASDDWVAWTMAVHPTGATTVSPSAIALTLAAEAPARIDQTIEPAAIALGLAPETPSVPQVLDAPAIALGLAILAPSQFDATAEPGGVALALTAVAPRSDLEAAPGPIAMAVATAAPDVIATIAPAAIAVTVAVVGWDRMDVDASPGPIALAVTPLAPEVGVAVLPDPLALAIATTAPARFDQDASPGPLALSLSPLAPTRLDFEITPGAQGVTLTPVAFARVDQDASPAAIVLTLALPAPAVNAAGTDTISPDPLSLTLAAPAPQTDLDATVGALGLSLATPAPQVDQAIHPDPAVLTITAIAPVTDQAVAPATLTILLEAPSPLGLEHQLLADVIGIALALLAPSLTNEGGVITGSLRAVSVRIVLPAGGMTSARGPMTPGAGPATSERITQPE